MQADTSSTVLETDTNIKKFEKKDYFPQAQKMKYNYVSRHVGIYDKKEIYIIKVNLASIL